jgi:hypothetical protein
MFDVTSPLPKTQLNVFSDALFMLRLTAIRNATAARRNISHRSAGIHRYVPLMVDDETAALSSVPRNTISSIF